MEIDSPFLLNIFYPFHYNTYIMAFGDHLNDLEMIKWASLGVAMKNSELELKRVADYIAVSNNGEGVCEVLENIF